MSDLGKYTFLPWVRQGLSTQINEVDGTAVTGRADLTVTVQITGGSESEADTTPLAINVQLLGPSDVKAFDTRAITRHWPRPDVFEVEPNYFPLVELWPADVAWRYTPARANAQDRLRPWLALIVLRDDEIDKIDQPTPTLPLSKLTTKAGAPLPRTDQLWAWAHVHVDGSVPTNGLRDILDSSSHQVVARLLCPRRLDQRTAYTAFVVPALEAARLSVLGLPNADQLPDATAAAWLDDGSAAELPIFYSWRFQTSDSGDFESLARRIVPTPLPATAGQRPMDVSAPGMGRPAAASTPLPVESALKPLDAQETTWDPGERQAWTSALAEVVNLPEKRLQAPGAPRTLAPPLYGRWYAATGMLVPTDPPVWFQDLNADPRTRVTSALGWQVVQNEQQQLLAGAWAQVDAVRAANSELRNAQLARETAIRLYERHVLVRSQPSLATFTNPLHARLLMSRAGAPAATVRALVQQSPLRAGVLHPTFLRLSRPLGPVGVRQGRAFIKTPPTVIDRVNSGTLAIAPPPKTPTTMVTPTKAGTEIAPPWLTPELADWLAKIPRPLWLLIEELLELLLAVWPKFVDPPLRQEIEAFLKEIQSALALGGSVGDDLERRIAARDGTLTPAQIQSAPPRPGFVARELEPDGTLKPLPASTAPEDTRFRDAVAVAFGNVNAPPSAGEVLRPIDVPAVTSSLASAIDPRATVAASLKQRIGILPPWHSPDPLEPVMAAPTFSQPLYKPLYDISPDWILAGLGALPQDVVSLAHPNERFIESFMLGANDEMGRTLLFNEYPTDQRGSYFRQFWDVRGVANPQPDINPIAQWPKTAALGDNATRPGADAYLVLVIRAELLRRYPNTTVYAVKAQWSANNDGTRSASTNDADTLHPDFQGSMGTGAGFWGFKLTTAQARGADTPTGGDAGWYFVLQEHSSEPRFGLEPASGGAPAAPRRWQDLAWSDLADDATAVTKIAYIDLGTPRPDVSQVADAANAQWHVGGARASDLAYITYRDPVRLLVHASRMIPSDA